MHKIIKAFGYLIAAVCLLFGLLPLVFYGIFHTGVAVLLVFGALLLTLCLVWDLPMRYSGRHIHRRLHKASEPRRTRPFRRWRIVRSVLAIGFALCILGAGAVSAFMLSAAFKSPDEQAHTVLILGCQVIGQEPSKMLRYRLDAAQRYLQEHPDAPVVVSGGKNQKEEYSEAQIMQKELMESGIAQDRIYLEDRSSNTDENIRFSTQVISENNLPANIAISTDSFHQLRAAVYAERNGLAPSALTSKTPPCLLPSYWVREFFGLVKAMIA